MIEPWPITACIALGSNVGDREATLRSAIREIDSLPETRMEAVSCIRETNPVGPPGQGAYLNAALRLRTALRPRTLLDGCLAIERAHGRDRARTVRWGPRTLDLDLLLYDDLIVDEPGLTIPHPRLHERLFVLEPLAEIAGDLVHPRLNVRISSLLERLLRPGPAGIPLGRDVLV
jgi:2-amino-4-hydroxy-6-hydroxymethyldihydropteridine diphosphokinase